MNLTPFRTRKIAEAAAVVLKAHTHPRMSRLRLLKILYIADREYLKAKAHPITGDKMVAMDHGPVLSKTYNLIKGKGDSDQIDVWRSFLRTDGLDVEWTADPGEGDLSRQEVTKLREVTERYAALTDYQIAKITHEFPEWKKNKPAPRSVRSIPLDDLLEATGLTGVKDQLVRNSEELSRVDKLLRYAARQ